MPEARSCVIGSDRPLMVRELTIFGAAVSAPERVVVERVIRPEHGPARIEPTNLRAGNLPGGRALRLLDIMVTPGCWLKVSLPAEERGFRLQDAGRGAGPVRFYADEAGRKEVRVAFEARTEEL